MSVLMRAFACSGDACEPGQVRSGQDWSSQAPFFPSAPALFATVMGIGRDGHTLDGIVQQQQLPGLRTGRMFGTDGDLVATSGRVVQRQPPNDRGMRCIRYGGGGTEEGGMGITWRSRQAVGISRLLLGRVRPIPKA